jgi:hypothetical protein
MTIEVHTAESPMTIISAGGEIRVQPGAAESPDLVISGPPDGVVGLLAGVLDKTTAAEHGVTVRGDPRRLARLRSPKWDPTLLRVPGVDGGSARA